MTHSTWNVRLAPALVGLCASLLLAACGDGGGGGGKNASATPAPSSTSSATVADQTPAAPAVTPPPAVPAPRPQTPTPQPAPANDTELGAATLAWVAPLENTDGSALTDLAGFTIMHGPSPDELTQVVKVSNPSISMYVLEGLPAGTHYFAVKAYTSSGAESAQSDVGIKTIS
jgi:hypothetical protein